MIPNFFFHPRMLAYEFGPQHPLKPERLARAVRLIRETVKWMGYSDQADFEIDPGPGRREDVLRVHSERYVAAVEALSSAFGTPLGHRDEFGFGSLDNPAFSGMFEASLAYVAGSVAAAERVRDGDRLAFNLSGGLHHALRDRASGFCVFNDPAIAIHILLERCEKVAYVDIDVHHGDGVQWIWYDDPRVLTCSIHEDGRRLFPGTGGTDETGPHFTSVNVPLEPFTTGDVWLWAFEQGILRALKAFRPEAVVLQMGTDAHFLDPLAHLQVSAQDWLAAVGHVGSLDLPLVALGGGGYNLTTVPRMWAAAVLSLSGVPFEDEFPPQLADEWGTSRFFDPVVPGPKGTGRAWGERVIEELERRVLPHVGRA